MSTEQKKVTKEYIESLGVYKIATDELVKAKFIMMYNAIHRGDAEAFYDTESRAFNALLLENEQASKNVSYALISCSKASLYNSFIDIAVYGYSVTKTLGLAYVLPRAGKAIYQLTADGELQLRIEARQLKWIDTPKFYYEGEVFEETSTTSGKSINHIPNYNRPVNAKVILCYIRYCRYDNSTDIAILDSQGMERLKSYANEKMQQQYTKNNGQPDLAFWATKTKKALCKTLPKVKISNDVLASEQPDNEVDISKMFDDRLDDDGFDDNFQPNDFEQQPASYTISQIIKPANNNIDDDIDI